jgi:hypothetical protein
MPTGDEKNSANQHPYRRDPLVDRATRVRLGLVHVNDPSARHPGSGDLPHHRRRKRLPHRKSYPVGQLRGYALPEQSVDPSAWRNSVPPRRVGTLHPACLVAVKERRPKWRQGRCSRKRTDGHPHLANSDGKALSGTGSSWQHAAGGTAPQKVCETLAVENGGRAKCLP